MLLHLNHLQIAIEEERMTKRKTSKKKSGFAQIQNLFSQRRVYHQIVAM
jgi:hypothetical protein